MPPQYFGLEKMLEPTFEYAATYYLSSIWMGSDRKFTENLGDHRSLDEPGRLDETREFLVKAATDYSVVRGFKTGLEDLRLEHLRAMLQASIRPNSDPEAIVAVSRLAESLRSFYGKKLISAASKFLWFRYKSPVIIYDALSYAGLKALGFTPDKRLFGDQEKWYGEFTEEWRKRFQLKRVKIIEACDALKRFKKFTAAYAIEDSEFCAWVESEWFRERVFDAFLIIHGWNISAGNTKATESPEYESTSN